MAIFILLPLKQPFFNRFVYFLFCNLYILEIDTLMVQTLTKMKTFSPMCLYILTLADSLLMKIYLSNLASTFIIHMIFFCLYSIDIRCVCGNCCGEAGHLFAPISKAACVQFLLRIYLSRWYDNSLLVLGERAMLE